LIIPTQAEREERVGLYEICNLAKIFEIVVSTRDDRPTEFADENDRRPKLKCD
jgi:hypothetical protein